MKRKLIFCTIMMTTLLFGGCGRNNTQTPESSPTPVVPTPVVTTDTTQPTASPATGSERTMISEEEARQIALNHAGLTAEQVTFIKSDIDVDNGKTHYDVEFYTSTREEYDYEIDPYTKEILNFDYDTEQNSQTSSTTENANITETEAQEIALAQVPGATTEDIRDFKSDYDNSKLKYEGKIYYENTEYEFEIDANTGEILEWDIESVHKNPGA